MLKKRIIPKLLIKIQNINNSTFPVCVTTKEFKDANLVGDPISQGKILEAQKVDEIFLINYRKYNFNKNSFYFNFLKEFSTNIFLPLTVGGNISSIKDIEMHLKNGAEKVCLNTVTGNNLNFLKESSKIFGKQCIVVSIDFKKDKDIYFNCGKDKIKKNIIDWSKQLEDLGVGEIVLNDIDRDGKMCGLNLKIAKKVSDVVKVPVILSGGCGLAEHFIEAFKKTNIQGISASTYFSFKDQNFEQIRSQVINQNIPLR